MKNSISLQIWCFCSITTYYMHFPHVEWMCFLCNSFFFFFFLLVSNFSFLLRIINSSMTSWPCTLLVYLLSQSWILIFTSSWKIKDHFTFLGPNPIIFSCLVNYNRFWYLSMSSCPLTILHSFLSTTTVLFIMVLVWNV